MSKRILNGDDRVPPRMEDRVFIGKVVKLRGLRGDLKVVPITWRPKRFQELEGIWALLSNGEERYLTLKRVRVEPGMVYIRFHENPTRELAEPLVGAELFIDESDRAELPAGMYYHDDLVGCEIECRRYGRIGTLREVMTGAAQDLWLVDGPYGEVAVPAVGVFVTMVDIVRRKIEVDLPEGLIEEQPEQDREHGSPETER